VERKGKIVSGAATMGAIVAIISSWLFFDSYWAHADELRRVEQSTIRAFEVFERRQIVKDLNRLSIKEKLGGGLSSYDEVLKEQLELDLKLISGDKK